MNRYKVVTTNGLTISLFAEDFERDQRLGRLAFRIRDSNIAMFELSNIVGFYLAAQEGE